MTNEYRLDIKVRNNLLLQRIEERGYGSLLKFCEHEKLGYGLLSQIINLKASPLDSRGKWRPSILKLCEKLNCLPEELFTQNQMDVKSLDEQLVLDRLPDDIENALDTLTPREKTAIQMQFGLGEYDEAMTLEQIANHFEVTRERIRQILLKAMRKLRHPSRSSKLRIEHLPGDFEEDEYNA